jgi:LGFP repeat
MSTKYVAMLTASVVAAIGLAFAAPARAAETPYRADAGVETHVVGGAGQVQPYTCYAVGTHFFDRWSQDQGGFGCAITPESSFQNGSFQEFERGEMDWSPSQGANMVASGKKYTYSDGSGQHAGIIFQFGPSDPYNYDVWLIRTTVNGNYTGQPDCGSAQSTPTFMLCGRTGGWWYWTPAQPGHWQIVAEGCDVSWSGSHDCRQGWTIPVDLWL